MKPPAASMVPHVAAQVTPWFGWPVTVAVNVCVPLMSRVTFLGDTATAMARTLMATVLDLVGSATLVAMTWKVPAVSPAVKRPASMVAPELSCKDQVTAPLAVPVTLAVNVVESVWSMSVAPPLMLTTTSCTVICSVAFLLESALAVAVSVYVPAVAGAV